jgi:DNA-binding beta-propeller fold protein YncE
MNWVRKAWQEISNFWVQSGGTYPGITSISPQFGFEGDTVIINGSNFSGNTVDNQVLFFKKTRARVWQASPTQLTVTVPKAAMSGVIKAVVGYKAGVSPVPFVIGIKYGFVTNYNSTAITDNYATKKVTVIDFDTTSPGTPINYIRCVDKPYDAAVSPDGRLAYVTDYSGNKVCIIDTTLADSETASAVIKKIDVNAPRGVAVSPDGLEFYVTTNDGYFYTIRNQVLRTQDPFRKYLGGSLREVAVSATHQLAYVNKNTGSVNNGQIYFINLNQAQNIAPWFNSTYFKPEGLAISPDQSEIYVANNRSDAGDVYGDQVHSFSIYWAKDGSTLVGAMDAQILPASDAHDVNWPLDVIFDPRGILLYASFSEGYANTGVLGCSNNIGAIRPPAISGFFDAATTTKKDSPARGPHGLAISPGGDFVFSANFGYGAGSSQGANIMIIDNKKVKAAIDRDVSDNNYNLTGTSPESLESPSVYGNPGIVVGEVAGFDGPRNIAFQQFPIIDIYPYVVHLALGGVAPGANIVQARINPIYGNTVNIALYTGTVVELTSTNLQAGFTAQGYRANTPIFSLAAGTDDSTLLQGLTAGMGKILGDVQGYPSNIAFVTVPPQNFIQGLYAEPDGEANELTIYCLAAVVRNQTLFPRMIYIDNLDGDADSPGTQPFYFTWYAGSKFNKYSPRVQITASTTNENLIRKNMDCMVRWANFNSEGNPARNYKGQNPAWPAAATRQTTGYKNKYDACVKAAGDTMLDLLRTTALFPTSIQIGNTFEVQARFKTNKDILQYPDYTKGALAFFSPSAIHWDENIGDGMVSIQDAFTIQTTTFPNAGNSTVGLFNEKAEVTFGSLVSNNRVQVVIVKGVALVDQVTRRPQFVFLRLRNPNWPSVIEVYP